jgi:hypothetical protein
LPPLTKTKPVDVRLSKLPGGKTHADAWEALCAELRREYRAVMDEPIPARLTALIEQLRQAEAGDERP